MGKKVKYLPQQNPINREPQCKPIPGKQEIIGKGSIRKECRSTKEKGTVDLESKAATSFLPKKGSSKEFQYWAQAGTSDL